MARAGIIGSQFLDSKLTDFNGIDEYAYVDDPSFKDDTQGAFLFRYRPSSLLTSNGVKVIISYGEKNAANNSIWFVSQRRNGGTTLPLAYRNQPIPDVFCRTTNDGAFNQAAGEHVFLNETWVSWVVQSNGAAWQHAINGSLIASNRWAAGAANTGDWLGDVSGTEHRLAVGSLFRANEIENYSDHRHNEILYVNRPLTAGEITEWHNGGLVSNAHRLSFRSNIVSWWRMGESRDNDTTIYDEIGSNHLTLVNMTSANYLDA